MLTRDLPRDVAQHLVHTYGTSSLRVVEVGEQNEKKREIYLLNGVYVTSFIKEFKKKNLYSTKSTDFINSRLKKTGV